jgi:hypothetical protein
MQKERPGWQLNRAKSLKKPHQETAGETRRPRLLPQLLIKGSRTLAPLVRPWMSRCLGLPRGPISRPGKLTVELDKITSGIIPTNCAA